MNAVRYNIVSMQRSMLYLFVFALTLFTLSLIVKWSIYMTLMVVIFGVTLIIITYKKTRSLINPVTLFSSVWLVAIPISSFEYPVMEPMSQLSWTLTLGFVMVFAVGALFAFSIKNKARVMENQVREKRVHSLAKGEYRMYILVLLFGVCLQILQVAVTGTFGIFSEVQKSTRLFPGYSLLVTLPTISIFCVTQDIDKRKKKIFVFLTIIYAALQLMSGMRWTLLVCIITVLPNFEFGTLRRKDIKKIFLIILVIVASFIFVTNFRGGVQDKQKYFINTGIYADTAEKLVYTEIFRYIGMSERLIDFYYVKSNAGVNTLRYTLSPLEYILGLEYENTDKVPKLNIYGYNAQNIITIMYLDVGYLWPILAIAWSFIICLSYKNYLFRPSNVLRRYFWSISVVGIVVSFFSYIHFYAYWLTIFPLMIWLLSSRRIRFFWR